MWKGQIHIPGSGEMCMILSSFFSVKKKKKKLRKRKKDPLEQEVGR